MEKDPVIESIQKNLDRALTITRPLFVTLLVTCAYLLLSILTLLGTPETSKLSSLKGTLKAYEKLYDQGYAHLRGRQEYTTQADLVSAWVRVLGEWSGLGYKVYDQVPDFSKPGAKAEIPGGLLKFVQAYDRALQCERVTPLKAQPYGGVPAAPSAMRSPELDQVEAIFWCISQEDAFWKQVDEELQKKVPDLKSLEESPISGLKETAQKLQMDPGSLVKPGLLQDFSATLTPEQRGFIGANLEAFRSARQDTDRMYGEGMMVTLADVYHVLDSWIVELSPIKLPVVGETVGASLGLGLSGVIVFLLFHHWLLCLMRIRGLEKDLEARVQASSGTDGDKGMPLFVWFDSIFIGSAFPTVYGCINRGLRWFALFGLHILIPIGLGVSLWRFSLAAAIVNIVAGVLMIADYGAYLGMKEVIGTTPDPVDPSGAGSEKPVQAGEQTGSQESPASGE